MNSKVKLYAENENGERFEVKEISKLGDGDVLLVQSKSLLTDNACAKIEAELSQKTGKKVVVFDARIQVIGTI